MSIPSASRDATTKIFRCLQTLKCLGRKPSLWVGAFKSLASCKQNPEAISLPLRLSQRTWGGSPKEDEAGGRLKTTEVTHRILTGALGVEGPFALWHLFFNFINYVTASFSLPSELGQYCRWACLSKTEWIFKSRESLQSRLTDCVCWKRFQGELIPSLVCGQEAAERKAKACLVFSPHIPWAGKERNWTPALAVWAGTKTIQRKHCHSPLICKLQLFTLD